MEYNVWNIMYGMYGISILKIRLICIPGPGTVNVAVMG